MLGWHQHPRNGKIARLPEPTRNLINQMLDDGFIYRAIITRLRHLEPPLPYCISEMNLSNWFHGGYQDWLRKQEEATVRASLAPADSTALAPACAKLHPLNLKFPGIAGPGGFTSYESYRALLQLLHQIKPNRIT